MKDGLDDTTDSSVWRPGNLFDKPLGSPRSIQRACESPMAVAVDVWLEGGGAARTG